MPVMPTDSPERVSAGRFLPVSFVNAPIRAANMNKNKTQKIEVPETAIIGTEIKIIEGTTNQAKPS